MELKRLQVDLSEREHREIETLAEQAEMKTKREVIQNALTLFKWAVNETINGRKIVSTDLTGDGPVRELVMPCLAPFARMAEEMDRALPTTDEIVRRLQEPARPVDELIAEMRLKLEELTREPANRRLPTGGAHDVLRPVPSV